MLVFGVVPTALAKWLENKRLQEERLKQRRMYGKVTVKPTLMCMPKPKTPPVCTEEAIMLMMAESSPVSSKASPSKPTPKKVATSRRRGISSLRTLKEESLSMEGVVESSRIAPLESEVMPVVRTFASGDEYNTVRLQILWIVGGDGAKNM